MADQITFAFGIVMSILGIISFVLGKMDRAKAEGSIETKVDIALKGIEEIKTRLNKDNEWKESTSAEIKSHDEKIKTLFSLYQELKEEK